MTTKFDNLPVDELQEIAAQMTRDFEVIKRLLSDRMLAACPVKRNHVYRISGGRQYKNRRILVIIRQVIRSNLFKPENPEPYFVQVQGPLQSERSTTRDGFNRVFQCVRAEHIDIATGVPSTIARGASFDG